MGGIRGKVRGGWKKAGTNENDLEEHLLVDLHELLVPLVNVGGLAAGVDVIVAGAWGVALVVLTPLDDFLENGFVDLHIILLAMYHKEQMEV